MFNGQFPKEPRKCLGDGPPHVSTTGPRCPACQRAYNQAKRRKNPQYETADYRRTRKSYEALVAEQGGYRCARNGEWVEGVEFDLDHLPNGTLAPTCRFHNRQAGGRAAFKSAPPHIQDRIRKDYK